MKQPMCPCPITVIRHGRTTNFGEANLEGMQSFIDAGELDVLGHEIVWVEWYLAQVKAQYLKKAKKHKPNFSVEQHMKHLGVYKGEGVYK